MSLGSLSVTHVRSIEALEIELPPGLCLVSGPNGSGKTSLLEAIFLLGRGRSFRTRNNERLISRGRDLLRVTGQVLQPSGLTLAIGLEVTPDGSTARVGGNPVRSLADLAEAFPVQVVEPGVHKLVEEGGFHRRRWIDWAVFHVEPQFIDSWVRYTRALKQRNAALKTDASQAQLWEPELARLGEAIGRSRSRLVDQLQPYWRDTVLALTGLDVQLHYLQGWSHDHTLLESLANSRPRDELRHLTHVGPHRADVAVRLDGRPARDVLSRGQQKLVAVAMTLAQMRMLQELTQTTPTLLLDDPAAELDGDRLQRFIEQLSTLRCQLVVTSLHADSRLFGTPERTFQMGQGRVQPV